MEVMGDDVRQIKEHEHSVVVAAGELQAWRTHVVAEARAERRRGRKLREAAAREIEISTSAGGSGA